MLNPKKRPAHFSEQLYAKQVRLVDFYRPLSIIKANDSLMTTTAMTF